MNVSAAERNTRNTTRFWMNVRVVYGSSDRALLAGIERISGATAGPSGRSCNIPIAIKPMSGSCKELVLIGTPPANHDSNAHKITITAARRERSAHVILSTAPNNTAPPHGIRHSRKNRAELVRVAVTCGKSSIVEPVEVIEIA